MSRRTLRWGVLGAARIAAQAVVPALQAAGDQVLVLGSRDPGRGRAAAAKMGIPMAVDGYQGVLEQDLDAIYVPLPNALHRPWVLAALASGKHVLCEKPLGLSALEAEEMAAAAQRAQLVLAEAVMYRYHPRWQLVMDLVRRGELGAVRQLSGGFSFRLRPPPDVRWEGELGGGALYDVGSYLINASRWVVGREPERAVALATLRRGVDESTSMLLEFAPGQGTAATLAALSCGFATAGSEWLRIEGDQAAISIPKPFTAWHDERPPILVDGPVGERRIDSPAADPYLEMVAAFGRAVEALAPVQTSAEDAAGTLAVVDACRASWLSGTWQDVDAHRLGA
ncbi:MAG TPA: Gfo/Idh/MocA family oxidoreductase [Candidatus Nanopelagicaceae bacterium]|nr:Gfo/Idh/MocA family oxidoreductase [Candidatus Nanopelagicaceae bacterium]